MLGARTKFVLTYFVSSACLRALACFFHGLLDNTVSFLISDAALFGSCSVNSFDALKQNIITEPYNFQLESKINQATSGKINLSFSVKTRNPSKNYNYVPAANAI